jgi:hypothetical protein
LKKDTKPSEKTSGGFFVFGTVVAYDARKDIAFVYRYEDIKDRGTVTITEKDIEAWDRIFDIKKSGVIV